jgi:phage/plasmid-associated DNA primase
MAAPITTITRKRGDSNQAAPEKLRMKGRRCGVFAEAEDDDSIKAGIMKELTGGDAILVRDLFKGADDMIQYKPQMKYWLTCNKLPSIKDNSDGAFRRIRVIDFNSKFVANPTKPNEFLIDNVLKQKIPQWGPALASYLIHIYVTEYKKLIVLEEPEEVMASTLMYKMENDIFSEFVNECVEKSEKPCNGLTALEMWEFFKLWAKDDNTKLPKRGEFLKEIRKIFGEPTNKNRYPNFKFKLIEKVDEPVNELDV